MDGDATVPPPPAKPASTRETVADLSLVVAHILSILMRAQSAHGFLGAAVAELIANDKESALTHMQDVDRLGATIERDLDLAWKELENVLKRFAGEPDA